MMKIILILILSLFSISFLSLSAFAQVIALPNDFGINVYEIGGQYFAKDSQNHIFISSDTPDVVIKTALDKGGEIYVSGSTYYLSKDFSGFDIPYGTHLKLAQDTHIVVPSGYSGYVFRFNGGTGQSILEGGNISEANPISGKWIGIMMQGGSTGVFFNFIKDMIITDPYITIDFNATTGQWINANTFVNIKSDNFVKGIEFDFSGYHTDGMDGFDGNTFRDLQFQSGHLTTYGVKDIEHQRTAFYNVQFWDLPPNAISSTIDSSAKDTMIIGGLMTSQGFVDNGKDTIVLDAWHNSVLSNSSLVSVILNGTFKPKVNTLLIQANNSLNPNVRLQPANGFVKMNKTDISQEQMSAKSNATLLGWIKIGAKLWSQGKIDDDIFGNSVLYLYKVNTTDTLNINQEFQNQQIHVPIWFKNNAKWWADGQISDGSFISEIRYLIKFGIIQNS